MNNYQMYFKYGALFMLITLLFLGCGTIGNQHFYALNPNNPYIPLSYIKETNAEGYNQFLREFLTTKNETETEDPIQLSGSQVFNDANFSSYILKEYKANPITFDTTKVKVGGTYAIHIDPMWIPNSKIEEGLLNINSKKYVFKKRYTIPLYGNQSNAVHVIQLFNEEIQTDTKSIIEPSITLTKNSYHTLVSPSDPFLKEKSNIIKPNSPLTLSAHRLYLDNVGEGWLARQVKTPAEIAVVATVNTGGEEPKPFLASYHEKVSQNSFVPFWGPILYATEKWNGDPIVVKIQVFDLDGNDNKQSRALLNSASKVIATLQPQYAPAVGIATAIGNFLIENNSDDEILRFEFTLVNSFGNSSNGNLQPYDGNFLILRPRDDKSFLKEDAVNIDDQWILRTSSNDLILNNYNYLTFSISSNVSVPTAYMHNRAKALQGLIDTGALLYLSGNERADLINTLGSNLTSGLKSMEILNEYDNASEPTKSTVYNKLLQEIDVDGNGLTQADKEFLKNRLKALHETN